MLTRRALLAVPVAAGLSRVLIEFARTSTHLATLPTMLQVIREAAHPDVRPMLDFFHFWSGLSKFEDLDLLEHGSIRSRGPASKSWKCGLRPSTGGVLPF